MKKVKTFLASIMIILATAVLTACSCSGSETPDDGVQIPVNSITISSDFEKATRDEETGYLEIMCSLNEEFDITYSLAPDNTTRTQVDWDFEDDDSVVVVRKNYYTYSQSATHTVGFRANKVGNTVIKFKPKNTDKWTQATVIVGEAESVWPTFVAPTGLDYNPETGRVSWNHVSQVKLANGSLASVSTTNGKINGLAGYLISYTNLETGDSYTTPENQPFVENYYELERGYTYEVSVRARGDNFSHKSSESSETFKFKQLATATNLKNNNGEISFNSVNDAEQYEVYYEDSLYEIYKKDKSKTKYINLTPDESLTNVVFKAGEKFDKMSTYNIYVKAYPKNFAYAQLEKKDYFYDESTQIRYYPSLDSEKMTIYNLEAPVINLSNVRGLVTVDGCTFGEESSDNNPYLKSILSWDISKTYSEDCQVKFAYSIYKNTSGNKWSKIQPIVDDFAVGKSYDLSQLSSSATNVQYKIQVYTFGNSANTIDSTVFANNKPTELYFNMLTCMDQSETSITNTTLTTSTANSNLHGIDLFFINKDDSSKSVYKFYSGEVPNQVNAKQIVVNLTDLNLTAGRYDIYGRFVGMTNKNQTMSATSDIIKINNNEVIVASAVENNSIEMTSAGILSFKKINNISNYQLNISQTQSGRTDSFAVTLEADGEGERVSADVYQIIRNHLVDDKGILSDNLEEEFQNYTSNSTITITITSIGIEQFGINSSSSRAIKFRRLDVVDNSTISLNNNKLKFTPKNTSTNYLIEIKGKIHRVTSGTKLEPIEIDLANASVINLDAGEEDKKLLDFVNKSEPTTIKIYSTGSTSRANGSEGFVDSYATTKTFNCTEIPNSLKLNENGDLEWNLSDNFTNEQSFILTLYTRENGDWQEYSNYSIIASRKTISQEPQNPEGENQESGIDPQSLDLGNYTYNILDKISEIPADTTVAITVTHKISDRFTNIESDKYYTVLLSQVGLSRTNDAGHNAVEFTTLSSATNIKYTLTAENLANVGAPIAEDTITITNTEESKYIKHLSDLNITDVGNYTISLQVSKTTTGTNSVDNPFVLNSLPYQLTIDVISRDIIASANGENISWEELNNFATYQIKYQKVSALDYEFVKDSEENRVFTNDSRTLNVWNLFEAGVNKIVIIPDIDFIETGVVLVGNEFENSIEKLPTISALASSSGVLTYTLPEGFDYSDYNVIVKADEEILSTLEYEVNQIDKTISITSNKYVGERDYTVQLTKENAISSDFSSIHRANKFASVQDLEKSGEWIIFTPITGANVYDLIFESTSSVTKTIKFASDKIYIENNDEGASWQEVTDTNNAKFENGKIYLNINFDYLGIDIGSSGIYYYSIIAKTDLTNNNLNGNVSTRYTIAKLSSAVDVSVEDESFIISNYIRGTNSLETPESINYSINYAKAQVLPYEKGDSWQNITWQYDPSKFNENEIVNYILTFATSGDDEDAKEYTQTFTFNPATGDIKLLKIVTGNSEPEGESQAQSESNIDLVEVNYITKSVSENIYTFTYNYEYIINNTDGISSESMLGEIPDSAKIEYTEKKEVYSNSIPFSSVNIEGESSHTINLNDIGLLDDGEYTLSLTFIGNGNEVVSSDTATSEAFNKMSTTSLSTVDGVISWAKVDNASSYTIRIKKDIEGGVMPLDEGEESEGTGEGEGEGTGEGETPVLNEWLFEKYTFTPNADTPNALPNITEDQLKENNSLFTGFEVGKKYSVEIMANGERLSSKWSDKFTVQKLQAPTNITIDTTGDTITVDGQTVKIGEPMLTWSDPNNIANRPDYSMKIGDNDEIIIHNTASGNYLSGQLLPSNIASGNYPIAMRVLGNTTTGTNKIGLLTSDLSEDANPIANYVTESSSVRFENDTFTWQPVTGAYTYKLTFFEGSMNMSSEFANAHIVFTTFTTTNSYNFTSSEFSGVGYYTVLINAICDPSKAIVSSYIPVDESTGDPQDISYTNCSTIYKSADVERVMVYNGLLAWTLRMSDVRNFVKEHVSEGDSLLAYFTENGKVTVGADVENQLLGAVVNYISEIINNGQTGDANVNAIISNLYTFRANINGVETIITPTTVDPITITNSDGKNNYNIVSAIGAEYLMFKVDMATYPVEEDGEDTTSKFTIKIAPKGNNMNGDGNGLISTVDGRYTNTIVVYKPKTPTAINIDDGETIRKQITNGELYWSLVTTEDSTPAQLQYHKNYKITAINQNNIEEKVSRDITIEDSKIEGSNYKKYLKDGDLFGTAEIQTNTNYKLQISVLGTSDSTLLNQGEKIYLNSNIFNYTDIMNILSNGTTSVSSGKYSYAPCTSMSTQTDVYVYGPFKDDDGKLIYAPDEYDRTTWAWSVKVNGQVENIDYSAESSGKSYADALATWKKLISYSWNSAKASEWADANNLRQVYHFKEETTAEGDNVSTSRQTTLNLTGENIPLKEIKYGAGSYIIRKQEIGNGRGIIDTEFTEELLNGDDVINCAYEQIATKLDESTKAETVIDGSLRTKSIWLEEGKFVWKKVDRANAYRVKIEKVNSSTLAVEGEYSDIVKSTGTDINESYELPTDRPEFNVLSSDKGSYVYRIVITATHLEIDESISNNYFEGEKVNTDAYGRAPIPTGLSIDENGIITWNNETNYSSIKEYQVMTNSNSEGAETVIKNANTSDNSYDLSKVDSGRFEFSIRSIGNTTVGDEITVAYINSCYTTPITITKLQDPTIRIEQGSVVWGNISSETMQEQPTMTIFKLVSGNETLQDKELPVTDDKFILHSEIDTFDSDYRLANEIYKEGTYTYGVKYKGTSGEVSDERNAFVIASSMKELTATKLSSPVLSSVDVTSGVTSENRIRWNMIENASGYRVLVIAKVEDSELGMLDRIFDITEIYRNENYEANINIYNNIHGSNSSNKVLDKTIDSTSDKSKDYFAYDNTKKTVDLRLSEVITTLGLNVQDGISLNVYVQAIGTDNSLAIDSPYYISGSFSDKKNVEIPAKPSGVNFDASTGTLSWQTDESKGHNAKITMTYVVNGVSESEFINYWKETSDSIQVKGATSLTENANAINNRYSEITSRVVEYEVSGEDEDKVYVMYVTDVVFLKAQNGNTPTSYQVTNVGTQYTFSIRIMVGDQNYNGVYMSAPAELLGENINFAVFSYGDGSSLAPYGVANSTMFSSIRYYTSAYFEITDDIDFKDTDNKIPAWEIIDVFSGYIAGNNKTVSNIIPESKSYKDGSTWIVYSAIIRENTGTIENLNITTSNKIEQTTYNTKISLAGFVITNSGTLRDVHIKTFAQNSTDSASLLVIASNTLYNTRVGGLAVENSGAVENCSVTTPENYGLYAVDSQMTGYNNLSTYVAGLVNNNTGSIYNSYFSGSLYGNMIGGLTNENTGNIYNSYSLGVANVIDAGTNNVTGKGVTYGGISCSVSGNATIENCYTRMLVKLDIQTNSNIIVPMGGLFARVVVTSGITNNITIKNCYVEYKLKSIGKTANVNISAYVVAPAVSSVTYIDNYYLLDKDNINVSLDTIKNETGVATATTSVSELVTRMTSLKDESGKDIYVTPTTNIDGVEGISKYPLLSSNIELTIITA